MDGRDIIDAGWRPVDHIEALIGERIIAVRGEISGSEELIIRCESGREFLFAHMTDCSEEVALDDFWAGTAVWDSFRDGRGSLVVDASERWDSRETEHGSETDTFYRIDTDEGSISFAWKGESNGYYSEHVDMFTRMTQ